MLSEKINAVEAIIVIEAMDNRGGTELVALGLADALNRAGVATTIVALKPAAMRPLPPHVTWIEPQAIARYGAHPESRLELLTGSHRREGAMKRMLGDLMRQTGARALINFTYEAMRFLPETNGRTWLNIAVFHWSVRGYESSIFDIIAKKSGINRLMSHVAMRKRFGRLHERLKSVDRLVALTEAGRDELVDLGAPNDRICVIPNFLPYDRPTEKISNLSSRRAIFVGRLSVEKGVWRLLDIWQRVSAALPDVRLDIFGEGVERKDLELAVAKRGLSNVTFKGFENDPSVIYGNADLLLCTSDSEGFGMVLIEAMYHGVIPITFDCPVSPAEIISDGGVAVPCFDTDGYADKVIELWNNPAKMKELQQRALRRSSDYLRPKIIKQWKQLLRHHDAAITS